MPSSLNPILEELRATVAELVTQLEAWDISWATALTKVIRSCRELASATSGSWIGYHASVYYGDFKRPPRGVQFDRNGIDNDDWREYSYGEFRLDALSRAGFTDARLEDMIAASTSLLEVTDSAREEIESYSEVATSLVGSDQKLERLLNELKKRPLPTQQRFVDSLVPRSHLVFHDARATQGGVQIPHHVQFEGLLAETGSPAVEAKRVLVAANKIVAHLKRKQMLGSNGTPAASGDRIFIGHGRSPLWLELKDFIENRLGLSHEEFNRESVAGKATTQRLNEMLDASRFAFLVLTAEDERSDGTVHARANVIHEAGLFQGRLGFEKAILLVEDGCEEFSNVHGLTQIRFPTGRINGAFEEIREVLDRERISAR